MNYCINAADVVEYSKVKMGLLPARKNRQLLFLKQITKKAVIFCFTSGLLLRKKKVPWFCNKTMMFAFLSPYLYSARRVLMLHGKCIGQENYVPHPTQNTLQIV